MENDDVDLVATVAHAALEWALRRHLRGRSLPPEALSIARQALRCYQAGHDCSLTAPPALMLDGEKHVNARSLMDRFDLWRLMPPLPETAEPASSRAADAVTTTPENGRA